MKKLTEAQQTQITLIIVKLILKNAANGNSYQSSKDMAYQRMNAECPEVFDIYLKSIKVFNN